MSPSEFRIQRLGWLLIVATIPAGIVGVVLEHPLRTLFALPLAAAGFLFVNGLVLATAEVFRRRSEVLAVAIAHGLNAEGARRLDTLEFREAVFEHEIEHMVGARGVKPPRRT